MKTHIRILSTILLAVVSCVPALDAQSATGLSMNVPFAFQYGGQSFAPGVCRMTTLGPGLLQLRCGSVSGIAMVQTRTNRRAARTGYALFTKYGDRYFLEEVRVPGTTAQFAVYESKWEKLAAHELAQGGVPTPVELALLETDMR